MMGGRSFGCRHLNLILGVAQLDTGHVQTRLVGWLASIDNLSQSGVTWEEGALGTAYITRACGVLFQLLVDAGGPGALWAAISLGRWS